MTIDDTRTAHFPLSLDGGIEVRSIDPAQGWQIAGELSAQVFTPLADLGLLAFEPAPPELTKALDRHTEHLMFFNADDEPIGWSFGNQQEADTFFMKWTGILPEYQNQGLYSAFLQVFVGYCKALGYARVTSNHMVNNRRVIVAKMKSGFVASGFELDERWGAMLRLTYFTDDTRKQGYERAFSLENYD